MAPMGGHCWWANASGDWQHTVQTNAPWGGNLAMLGFSVGFYLPAACNRQTPRGLG